MGLQSFLMMSSQVFPDKTEKAHNFGTCWPNLMFYIWIYIRIWRSFWWHCQNNNKSFTTYQIFLVLIFKANLCTILTQANTVKNLFWVFCIFQRLWCFLGNTIRKSSELWYGSKYKTSISVNWFQNYKLFQFCLEIMTTYYTWWLEMTWKVPS